MFDLSKQKQSLDWGPGMPYNGEHIRFGSSNPRLNSNYDFLLFTDSRGSAVPDQQTLSWTELLTRNFSKNDWSYLYVCRPKEMTIFFTLINFLSRNDLHFKYLLTNVGFVDFTPKKKIFVEDILDQCPFQECSADPFIPLGEYPLSSGSVETLYTFNYQGLEPQIARILSSRFLEVWLIGTIEFSEKIRIERHRPKEFFSQLKKTNAFLLNLAHRADNIHYFQPFETMPVDESALSYDAVHFTAVAHHTHHDRIADVLNIHLAAKMERGQPLRRGHEQP